MPPRTERRHQQGEESRQRILDATIQIAAERGYEGTSISLVSKRSGLPASSIYWHFASKDDLLAAVIERSFSSWLESLPARQPPPAGVALPDHLRATWRRSHDALAANADFLRLGLMLSLERRPSEPRAKTRFLDSRRLAHDRLRDWYADTLDWAGMEPDLALCETLATVNLAVADGLFIEEQITGDRLRAVELSDFVWTLFAGAVDVLATRLVPANPAGPPGAADRGR